MDEDAHSLSRDVAAKVKPQYQRWLKRSTEPTEAFSRAYDEVVKHVAQARKMSPEKTKFYSTDVLQKAMDLIVD